MVGGRVERKGEVGLRPGREGSVDLWPGKSEARFLPLVV